MDFHYDTNGKMREIFSQHCNLSMEQYEEIGETLTNIIADIQDGEALEEIETTRQYLKAVFDFLYNTNTMTLDEAYQMNQMLDDIFEKAQQTKEILDGARK